MIDEPLGSYHGGDVAAPVFREIAEQILPELGVAPDVEFKSGPTMVAQTSKASPAQIKVDFLQTEQREASLPKIAARNFNGQASEIVLAVASNRAALMPDMHGQSVRDVARTCAQLGLRLEARGEGHAVRQTPEPGAEVEGSQIVRVDFGRGN